MDEAKLKDLREMLRAMIARGEAPFVSVYTLECLLDGLDLRDTVIRGQRKLLDALSGEPKSLIQ